MGVGAALAVIGALLSLGLFGMAASARPVLNRGRGPAVAKVLGGAGRGIVYHRGRAGLRAAQRQAASCTLSCSGPLEYHSGAVMHAHTTYTIYWAPSTPGANGQTGTSFTPFPVGYESTINSFLANVAADGKAHKLTNAYSVDVQYGEPTSGVYESTFGQGLRDERLYPPRNLAECPTSASGAGLPSATSPCLTDEQIQLELQEFVKINKLPTGLGAMYFVFTPEGVASCAGKAGAEAECSTNIFCAYHYQTITAPLLIYANMPYDHVTGCSTPAEPNGTPADDEINTLSHEHNEAVTDPTGGGWYYGEFVEDADKCTYPFFDPSEDSNPNTDAYGPLLEGSSGSTGFNQIINGGHYLLQREWSNAAGGCVAQAPVPVASFAVYSTPALTGQSISFNGSSSFPSAGSITGYQWEFGDGKTASGSAEVSHFYEAPGEYEVRLTVTNDSGASNSVMRKVTVHEPKPGETTTVTTTVTTPAPPPEVITETVPGPAQPAPEPITITKTVNVLVPVEPAAYTAAQIAQQLGLPGNGAKLPGLGTIALGHAECPPACSVELRLYAIKRVKVHGRRFLKREFIGALTTRLANKGTGTLVLQLNAAGRKLLRKSHSLASLLVVTVTGKEGGSWEISRKLTLLRSGKAARLGRAARHRQRR